MGLGDLNPFRQKVRKSIGLTKKNLNSPVGKILTTIALSAALGPAGLGMSTAAAGGLAGAGVGASFGGGLKGAAIGGLTGYAAGASPLGQSLGQVGKGLSGPTLSGAPLSGTLSLGSALKSGLSNSIGGLTSGLSGLGNLAGLGGGGSSSGGLSSLMGAGNLLSTGANIYSGLAGNQAVKEQTKALTSANDKALALQAKMYDQTSENMSPFMTAGQSANSRLSALLGLGGQDNAAIQAELENSPGYQFRLQQGTKSMNQSLGARGMMFSGDALKAAQTFGQGLADQTYNDRLTQLANASAAGQSAAANQGAAGQNYANQGGQFLSNQGNIYASGSQASQNAINQSLANVFGSPVGVFSGQANKMLYDPYTGKRIS